MAFMLLLVVVDSLAIVNHLSGGLDERDEVSELRSEGGSLGDLEEEVGLGLLRKAASVMNRAKSVKGSLGEKGYPQDVSLNIVEIKRCAWSGKRLLGH